jgi:creatinine amidohydrolase
LAGRPYILAETALAAVRAGALPEVAVLPWGATEPHNLHLPYGTDSIQAERVAVEAALIATERGAGVVVLPTIPFGSNAQQLDTPLTIDLSPTVQAAILADVARSLDRHRVRKLVVLNGHGGTDFRAMVRELQPRVRVFLCVVDWWRAADADAHFDEPGDHAGELETSVMLHLEPGLVRPLDEAGPGRGRVFAVGGLREPWAWAPRDWKRVTEDTGVGNPSRATSEKGAGFFEAACDAVALLLVELAALDPDDPYVDG